MARPRHSSDTVSQAYRRTAAKSIIVQRDDLHSLNIESFCRSYRLREDEVRRWIGEELRRRARG